MVSKVKCPKCNHTIDIDNVIKEEIINSYKSELLKTVAAKEAELNQKISNFEKGKAEYEAKLSEAREKYKSKLNEDRKKITDEIKAEFEKSFEDKTYALRATVSEKDKILNEYKNDINNLIKEKAKLEENKLDAENEVLRRVAAEKESIREKIMNDAMEEHYVRVTQLEMELISKDKKLKEAYDNEISMRNEKLELEERQKMLDLEVARKLDQERNRIKADTIKDADKKYMMAMQEKDNMIMSLKKDIIELNHKFEGKNQQAKGEAAEISVENILKSIFKNDEIVEVSKGVKGADITQIVHVNGEVAGKIIWEVKNTKGWNDGWIQKLKQDQINAKADLAVIVSNELPEGVDYLENRDGIWVASLYMLKEIAQLFHFQILAAYKSLVVGVNRNTKAEMLYDYINSKEFKQKIEAMIDIIVQQKIELQNEQNYMNRIWAKRLKQTETLAAYLMQVDGSIMALMDSPIQAPAENEEVNVDIRELVNV